MPSSLINSTCCPHRVYMCFVWIWKQTARFSLYSINPLNAELNPICHLLILLGDLTFMGSFIVKYIQQDATLHSLFISGNCSTCFGWYFHPSSGAHTTVWSRVLLEKLTVNFAVSQKIPRIYETRKSLTVPTSARHLSLSWANSIQSPRPPPHNFLKIHLNIILPSTPWSPQWPLSLRLSHQHPVHTSILPHTRHMSCPSHSSRFYHPHIFIIHKLYKL
jgi:hypothetical protein